MLIIFKHLPLLFTIFVQQTLTDKFACSGDQHDPNSKDQYTESLPNIDRLILAEDQWYKFLKGEFQKDYGDKLNATSKDIVTNYTRRYEGEVIGGLKQCKDQTQEELTLHAIKDHPFLILRMYWRLSSEAMRAHSVVLEITGLTKIFIEPFATKTDIDRFSTLILLTTFFHDLDVYKFAQGNFGEVKTGVGLSPLEALHLAILAKKVSSFATAVILTAYAVELAFQHSKIPKKDLIDVLQEAIDKHDRALSSSSISSNDGFTEKIGEASRFLTKRDQFITFRRRLLQTRQEFTQSELESVMMLKVVRVCSATEDLRSLGSRSKLTCWYNHKVSPIAPYKFELLNEDPVLIKIHEFISKRDQTAIRTQALANLKPPDVRLRIDDEGRLSQIYGMNANLNLQQLRMEYIGSKIEALLGRELRKLCSGSWRLDVFSMTPGGHYVLSPDGDIVPENGTAVVLDIYLNEVKLGGRTIFQS